MLCRNCGAVAPGNYCSNCGQSTDVHVPSLAEFLHEFVSHHIAIEGTLVASVKRLLLSPGGLTLDYYAGRRARYVAPLRLYLTFNVIFFLALQLMHVFSGDAEDASARTALATLNSADSHAVVDEVKKEISDDKSLTDDERKRALDKIDALQATALHVVIKPTGDIKPGINLSYSNPSDSSTTSATPTDANKAPPKADSDDDDAVADALEQRNDAKNDLLDAVHTELKTNNPGNREITPPKAPSHKWQAFENSIIPAWADRHMPAIRRRLDQVPNRKPGEFADNALHYAPYTLLLLLPVCALLLQMSFIGCGRRYVEHLVAALHGHTFLFIVLLLFLPLSGVLAAILFFAALIHMVWALSRIYGSKWIGLAFRLGILSVSYTIAFVFATAGEFVFSILA